jgi:hypothetical protein
MNPRPLTARPLANYELEIKFTNDEIRIFDMKPHRDFGFFSELKNLHYFNQAKVVDGTVLWPNEQDICPDTLYLESRLASPGKAV